MNETNELSRQEEQGLIRRLKLGTGVLGNSVAS